MQNGAMKAWLDSSYLAGANQSYIEQLYEDFLTDPGSVEDSWRSIFNSYQPRVSNPISFTLKRAITSAAWRKTPRAITPPSPIRKPTPNRSRYCS